MQKGKGRVKIGGVSSSCLGNRGCNNRGEETPVAEGGVLPNSPGELEVPGLNTQAFLIRGIH